MKTYKKPNYQSYRYIQFNINSYVHIDEELGLIRKQNKPNIFIQ